jgi:hypothetical protein
MNTEDKGEPPLMRMNERYLDMMLERDVAYRERNKLIRFLAAIYNAGIKRTEIDGWDPKWAGCVYIDTPEGQMSWHYSDEEAPLFADLPPYEREWDGHTTEQKYERLATLVSRIESLKRK